FQAEDGIRDRNVTGVQTCALPISIRLTPIQVMAVARVSRPAVFTIPDRWSMMALMMLNLIRRPPRARAKTIKASEVSILEIPPLESRASIVLLPVWET